MSTDTIARHAAPKPRRGRSRAFAVVALLLAAWLGIAGVAFAAFMRTAAGTVSVSTGSPDSLVLTVLNPPTFTQTGQTKPLVLDVDPSSTDAGVSEAYTKYTLIDASVGSGPCAGMFTITGPANALVNGTGVLFRNVDTGAVSTLNVQNGAPHRRTEAPGDVSGDGAFALSLSGAAPAACADQPSIPLAVTLKLIP